MWTPPWTSGSSLGARWRRSYFGKTKPPILRSRFATAATDPVRFWEAPNYKSAYSSRRRAGRCVAFLSRENTFARLIIYRDNPDTGYSETFNWQERYIADKEDARRLRRTADSQLRQCNAGAPIIADTPKVRRRR